MTTLPPPSYDTLALGPPRIPYSTFLARLKSKSSPAVAEAKQIYDMFIQQGVDPSFALAQYRVESQYGTAGHAVRDTGADDRGKELV